MRTPLDNKNMIWVQPDKFLYDKMILTKMIVYYAILRHCGKVLIMTESHILPWTYKMKL